MQKALVSLAAVAAVVAALAGSAAAVTSSSIYDAVPATLPGNVASIAFEATSTGEVGDNIVFAGANRNLASVVVTMSDWALHSDYPALPSGGWTHPITFNIYAADHTSATPAAGALLATLTRTFTIPWRPEADPTCANGTAWRAANGTCYNGFAFNITFDFSALNVTLPNEIVFGVAFNTQNHGTTPLGVPGPYNSLNVGAPTGAVPTVGTDANADAVFWNSSYPGFWADGGAGASARSGRTPAGRRTAPWRCASSPSIRSSARRRARSSARRAAGRRSTIRPSRASVSASGSSRTTTTTATTRVAGTTRYCR